MKKILQTNIIITQAKNRTALQIRTTTTDKELIEQIISSAWNEKPLPILPFFKNRLSAINTLQQHKIIEKDEEGNFVFSQ